MDVRHAFSCRGINPVNDNAIVHLLGADAHLVNDERRSRHHIRHASFHLLREAIVRSDRIAVVRHQLEVSILPYHLGSDLFFETVDRRKRHHQRKHANGNAEHTENTNKRNKETLPLSPQVTPSDEKFEFTNHRRETRF